MHFGFLIQAIQPENRENLFPKPGYYLKKRIIISEEQM